MTTNPNYGPTSDPNYMGALKEPSRYDFNGGQKYDNLFSGLATGLKGSVEGAQELVKDFIKRDVEYGTDKLRDAQGVSTDVETVRDGGTASMPAAKTSTFGGQPGEGGSPAAAAPLAGNRPPNQEQVAGDYARVKAAYDQGKISDRNYYAQLEVMNRSLRSRYPGFRDEVDQMVHQITGVVPANALRKAILNDLQTAQQNSDALTKERQKLIMSNAQYLPQDAMQREAAGKPYSMAELYGFIQPQVKAEADVKDAKAQLELRAAKGNATSTDALQVATQSLGAISNRIINNVGNNDSAAAMMKQISDLHANGKVLEPQQQQEMLAKYQQLKYNTRAAMEAAFNEPLVPGSKETLATRINDRTKINQLIDAQMQPFEMIEKGLTDNNLGLVNVALNATKNMQNADLKKAYDQSGYLRAVTAIRAAGGDEILKQLMMRPEADIASQGAKSVLDIFKTLNLTAGAHTQSGTTSWDEQFKQLASTPGGNKASTVRQYVQDRVSELTDPSVPLELKANAAKVAFSRENINFLNKFTANDGSQAKIFNQLVSPAVTKSMIALRDSSPQGKQLWTNYTEWSMNNFMGMFKQAADGVNSTPDRQWISVNWNSNSKQFEVTPTPEGVRANSTIPGSAGASLINIIEGRLNSGTISSVERMNQGIKAIQPILEANGFKTEDEVKKLVNFNALKDKNNGFWSNLVKSVNGPDAERGDVEGMFGGTPANFIQPPGGSKTGRLSTEKDASSEVHNHGADLGNLSDSAKRMLTGLVNAGVVENVDVKSGYRDADRNRAAKGAKYSTHLDGDAIDIDISGYNDEQKKSVLEAAIAHGARGIGIYPGGRSLHIDTRDTPTTWGYSPFGAYRGVHWSAQPSWAHEPLKQLFKE